MVKMFSFSLPHFFYLLFYKTNLFGDIPEPFDTFFASFWVFFGIVLGLSLLVFVVFIVIFIKIIQASRKKKEYYVDEFDDALERGIERTCEYCGAVIHERELTNCPNCGAVLME